MIQGTEEWRTARCGKFTASRLADLIAKTKSGYGASHKNYLAELLVERMTGIPTEGYVNAAMQWGIDHEGEARTTYEFETGNLVEEVGFIMHPNYSFTGASPDGLIGKDGIVEIKCPNTATHIEAILGDVPKRYYTQIQWQLECAERQWCDYVTYDPRMLDASLVLVVKRIKRDDEYIEVLRGEVEAGEIELNALMEKVKASVRV